MPTQRLRPLQQIQENVGTEWQCGLESCLDATVLWHHRFEHPVEVHPGGGGDEPYCVQAATSGRRRGVLLFYGVGGLGWRSALRGPRVVVATVFCLLHGIARFSRPRSSGRRSGRPRSPPRADDACVVPFPDGSLAPAVLRLFRFRIFAAMPWA
jgi:hypothetical protein